MPLRARRVRRAGVGEQAPPPPEEWLTPSQGPLEVSEGSPRDMPPADGLSPAERADRAIAEVAAALHRLEGSQPAAPASIQPELPVGGTLPLPAAAQALGIGQHYLRRLLATFGDVLPAAVGDAHGQQQVARPALAVLREIIRWRQEGIDDASARRRAELALEEAKAGTALEAGGLAAQLQTLQAAILRQEQHRSEDRDRLLTAMMRTQQELQHLRSELATRSTRRERRRGWWARLWGPPA